MKLIADTVEDYAIVLNSDNEPVTATTLKNFGDVLTSSNASFDSGLMPQSGSGLLMARKFGQFTQIAYQEAPTESLVKWGEYENDKQAEIFTLAHPYKIFIADFHNDVLVGLRHFFSPEPIFSEDDILFHTPYPNTNCRGYSGTSVGWVCLYRTGTKPLLTIQEKIQYAWQRESGLHEPYNNSNMSQTDGPRFYASHDIELYNNPNAWQKKTKEEGVDWICNVDQLIPIKTTDELHTRHAADGLPYTFGDAVNKPYYPYYPHSLNGAETNFYSNGWGKANVNMKFDPKTLSKLTQVETPSHIDIGTILSEFRLKPKTNINFDVFDDHAATSFSTFVLEARETCCFCNILSSTSYCVMPYFLVEYLDDEEGQYYMADPYSNESNDVKLNYICSACATEDTGIIVNITSNMGTKLDAFVFKKKGALQYKNTVDSHYVLMEDLPQPTRDDLIYSRYLVKDSFTGNYIPQNTSILCLQCDLSYGYDIDDNIYLNPLFPAIVYDDVISDEYSQRYTLSCPSSSCKQKTVKISDFLLPNYLDILKDLHYFEEKDKDFTTAIRPLSEYKSLFKDALQDNASININNLNIYSFFNEKEEKPQYFNNNFHLQNHILALRENESNFFKVIDDLHEIPNYDISDFYLHDLNGSLEYFHKMWGNHPAYFAVVKVNSVFTLFIDTKSNLEFLISRVCQCDNLNVDINDCTKIQVCDRPVCSSCIKIDDKGNEIFNPIFIYD